MKSFTEIYSYIKTLDGWLSSHEAYFLYKAAKEAKRKGEIVEIGSWKGKSTICLSAGSKNTKTTAVDPHKGEYSKGKWLGKDAPTYKEFLNNLKKAGVKDRVEPLITTSEEAAKTWKMPIKLLFIDGLHDYKHAKQDYELWNPFVVPNGVISLHDAFCGHIGPERVVLEDILSSHDFKDIGVVGSIIYAKKGKPTLIESIFLLRTKYLIRLALLLNHINFPFKFFIIHRIIKILLLNAYTANLLFHKI